MTLLQLKYIVTVACGRNDQRGGKTALYRPAQPDFRNQGTGK